MPCLQNKKLWALYPSYHLYRWLTFKILVYYYRGKSIKNEKFHTKICVIEVIQSIDFFYRIVIVVIVLVAIFYRRRRGKKFCISISNFLYMYMYQHASLDKVSIFKVILRLGIGFRSLEQFFKKYFALLWFFILCIEHNNIR